MLRGRYYDPRNLLISVLLGKWKGRSLRAEVVDFERTCSVLELNQSTFANSKVWVLRGNYAQETL